MVKEWRKLVLSVNRYFICLRKTDIMFAGLGLDNSYEYKVVPEKKKMTIFFRKRK